MLQNIYTKFGKYLLFPSFYLIALILYFPAKDGMLTSDFYNWVYLYKNQPISELLTCYGYPGLHQLYHLPFFLAYKFFGLNSTFWLLLFVFIHAINTYLLYLWASIWLKKISKNNYWAIFTALLFLISPFQTEAVAWGATIHYLTITSLFLLSLITLMKFLESGKKTYWFWFITTFTLSLFTMEQSFLFPLSYLALAMVVLDKTKSNINKVLISVLLPSIVIFAIYFGLSKVVFGNFIGHYGAEEHLKFDFFLILNNLYYYFLKFFTFFRYLPEQLKPILLSIFTNRVFQIISIALFTGVCVKKILFSNEKKVSALTVSLLQICVFIFCLGPVINIVMDSLNSIQTDRYSYLASGFIYFSIILFIASLPRKLGQSVVAFLLIFSVYTLHVTVKNYNEAGKIKAVILESILPFQNDNEIWVLNMPDNYNGVHLFRNGFFTASDLHHGTQLRNKYQIVSHVNFTTPNDSITIAQIDNNKLFIQVPKWGRWIHTESHETELYSMKKESVDGFDLAYTLTLKENVPTATILYLNKGKWQQYQLN
jgi:hypothetical protein